MNISCAIGLTSTQKAPCPLNDVIVVPVAHLGGEGGVWLVGSLQGEDSVQVHISQEL